MQCSENVDGSDLRYNGVDPEIDWTVPDETTDDDEGDASEIEKV